MRVVEVREPGGPDVLRIAQRPRPLPGPGEVLIGVVAAGVNRPDLVQRAGRYPPPPGASDIPGLEVAGTILAVGPAVSSPTQWKPGDRVMALLAGGGYAEAAIAPAEQCLPIPDGLSVIEAAAMPETFFTVWSNVFERGRLQRGETLLVHGGSSGIGTTAIQMARALDARVIATAGTAAKCRACEKLGADRAINYREEDFVDVALAHTEGRGVDVILDMIGGDYLPRNIKVLAEDGRLVQIALMGGAHADVDLNRLMRRRLTVTGSTLRPRSTTFKGRIARALEEHVWPIVEAGRIKPVIHATFPLDQAADAHRALEEGDHIGKIVLVVDPSSAGDA